MCQIYIRSQIEHATRASAIWGGGRWEFPRSGALLREPSSIQTLETQLPIQERTSSLARPPPACMRHLVLTPQAYSAPRFMTIIFIPQLILLSIRAAWSCWISNSSSSRGICCPEPQLDGCAILMDHKQGEYRSSNEHVENKRDLACF